MITLTKQPIATLDPTTGRTTGIAKPAERPNVGIPTPEFHRQVIGLADRGVPLTKAHRAIDLHPGITDKARAKSMASAVYRIIGKK